ncbi:hypothetical protein L7F22_022140 [Adiantum nelumboides]|nr:hypothetical protein [Adiantum nelumboides]
MWEEAKAAKKKEVEEEAKKRVQVAQRAAFGSSSSSKSSPENPPEGQSSPSPPQSPLPPQEIQVANLPSAQVKLPSEEEQQPTTQAEQPIVVLPKITIVELPKARQEKNKLVKWFFAMVAFGKFVPLLIRSVLVNFCIGRHGLRSMYLHIFGPDFPDLFRSLSNPMYDVGSVHDTKAKEKVATENHLNAMPTATDTVKASQQRGASASVSASRETLKANNIEDPQEDGDNMPIATKTVKTSLQTMASASVSALRKSLKTNSTEDLQEVGDNMHATTKIVKTSLQTMASANGSALRESLKTQTTNSIEDLQEVGDNTPAANETIKTSLQTMTSASASASALREFVKANNIEDLQKVGDNNPLEGFLRKAKAKRKVGLEEVPEETASTGCGSPKKMEDKAESTKGEKIDTRSRPCKKLCG